MSKNKMVWIKKHFKRHKEPIHYIAYVDETKKWQPMTAEQFKQYTPAIQRAHKFDKPVIWEAVLRHGENKDVMWARSGFLLYVLSYYGLYARLASHDAGGRFCAHSVTCRKIFFSGGCENRGLFLF